MKLLLVVTLAAAGLAQQTENPLTQAVRGRYEDARQNLLGTAEAMPESNYEYRLTPEQRPFGEWLAHTAMSNYNFCAAIRGTAAPDTSRLQKLKTKSEIALALRESFEYCDEALKNMDDRKALTAVTAGARQVYPVQGMVSLVASTNEHYGNLVGYLRSKGIVPPSTARRNVRIPESPKK